MRRRIISALAYAGVVGLTVMGSVAAEPQESAKKYEANWESLNSRPNPQWFSDAKFGIFIHWGIYAVPSWAVKGEYSEWYWNRIADRNPNNPW